MTSGSGGGISATASHVETAGDVTISSLNATDPGFTAQFGTFYSTLNYATPAGLPGDIDSTLTFSPALPTGSQLAVVDVDFQNETLTFTSGGVPLTFVTQLESVSGASSIFPSWSPPALMASGPLLNNNDLEATVFDLSGVATLDISFDQGLGSGVAVAVFVPEPPPVPAVGMAGRAVLGIALLGAGSMVWRLRGGSISALRGRRPSRGKARSMSDSSAS